MGDYLDVKVGVFQVQKKEPVPWAYLREDLFQCSHPERLIHEGAFQVPEIEDGPQTTILFGDVEVTSPWLLLPVNSSPWSAGA